MGTRPEDLIGVTLFGRTRRAVLSLLYGHPDEEFYVRQIIRTTGIGQGTVQRELERLVAAGLICRREHGRQVYLRANRDSPVYQELRGLLVKTAGVADVLREALAPLADRIRAAFVYGSFARGDERRTSDVDVMAVGDAGFVEVSDALGSAQRTLGRELNPVVYSEPEFHAKVAENRVFVKTVLREPKVFLIGDEHELDRLAGKRLAD
ncbi:MAG: MarR family transcriptional regulator [bacterium]